MTKTFPHAVMALALASVSAERRSWALAMRAEFDVAAVEGGALSFASGCLVAAWRDRLSHARGRFVPGLYALALLLMLPMAALQIGCAVLGLPYLYPGQRGLAGAMLVGDGHEALLSGIYLSAVPSLVLLQLMTGLAHLRLAWVLVEQDWSAALDWALRTLAATIALIVFMGVLFLDSRQVLLQGLVVGIELALIVIVARRHRSLWPTSDVERTG
jgi:hypothetical protein